MKKVILIFLFLGTTQFSKAQESKREVYHIPNHENVEEAIGYSQAIKVGNTIYISGTVDGLHDDIETQVKTIYEYVHSTLSSYGANSSNVVKETVYTVDLDGFKKCIPIRKEFYKDGKYPTSTWVGVKELFIPKLKVEIEFIAVL